MIGLMNIRGVIVMAWAAANASLVGVLGHELDWGSLQEPPRPKVTAQVVPEVVTEVLPNFQLPPLEKKFTATTERPLFVSTRRQPPPPGTAEQVKPTMKKGQFQLLGTTITDEFRSAIVRELATGKIRPVMQDKLINGLLLESVEEDRIVFTQYDDKEELLLKIQPSPAAPSAAGAGAPPAATVGVNRQRPSRFGNSRFARPVPNSVEPAVPAVPTVPEVAPQESTPLAPRDTAPSSMKPPTPNAEQSPADSPQMPKPQSLPAQPETPKISAGPG